MRRSVPNIPDVLNNNMGRYSKYTEEAGIYKLTCIDNGKIYIGKTINFRRRLNEYKNIKIGKCYFEHAMVKHGWDSFNLEILEVFDNFNKLKDNLILLNRETYFIDLFDSDNREKGYNICKHSTDRAGIAMSEETKEKLRQINLGKKLSEETKIKIKESSLGRTHSEETKQKMSLSKVGKVKSEETKQKMRRSMSDETKEKLRQAHLGKKLSEDHKEKLRQSKLGNPRKKRTIK